MAFDITKPADTGIIAQGPAEIRENFRALKLDQIVDALSVKGWGVLASSGSVAGANWVRVANIAGGAFGSGLLKISAVSTGGKRAEIFMTIGNGELGSINKIGGANAAVIGHSRSEAAAIVQTVRVSNGVGNVVSIDLYQTETCTYTVTGFACEGVTLPAPAVGGISLSNSSVFDLAGANTNHGAQTFNASGAWLCPPGVFRAFVTAAGGGGGGGGAADTSASHRNGGGGGGGASCIRLPVAVIPGISYGIYIGAGGAGGNAANGATGGTTEIKIGLTGVLAVEGGSGGEAGVTSGIAPSGAGGVGLGTAGWFNGESGGVGSPGRGGNGGGSAIGSGANGGGSDITGSTASATEGNSAVTPGGGGGGASSFFYSGTRAGGGGAPGFVLLEW